MNTKLIMITLFTAFVAVNNPKDIAGKWQVENINTGESGEKMTPEQKSQVDKMFIQPLSKAIFNFEANHHFYLSANFPGMPKNDYWEYDEATGIVTVKEYNKPQSAIMKISITEKDGNTFFKLLESPVVLKVKKVAQ